MEENLADQNLNAQEDVPLKNDSLFSKLKLKFNFPPFVQTFLIPAVVILIILSIGGGGTYLLASRVLGTDTSSGKVSEISEANIPPVPSSAISKPTPSPTAPPEEEEPPVKRASPTALPSIVSSWPSYEFTSVFLKFNYPTGWSVNLGSTSGAPYLYIQNFSGSIPSTYSAGQYAVLVSRLEQVGIATENGLKTQIAINDSSNTYINGVNYGLSTVLSSKSLSVNGNVAYERTVNYSSFPNTKYYELYVLDGLSNAIKFMPLLDTVWGQPYFDLILSTVDFTN